MAMSMTWQSARDTVTYHDFRMFDGKGLELCNPFCSFFGWKKAIEQCPSLVESHAAQALELADDDRHDGLVASRSRSVGL